MGRWEPYVDARETREHLELLRKTGVGIDRIVTLSGVPRSTVRRLLAPLDLADSDRPRRIRPDVARRLLDVDRENSVAAPRSLVDARPTQQRIAELRAAGHSMTELARALGRSHNSLCRTLTRTDVTVETEQAVALLHVTARCQSADPS